MRFEGIYLAADGRYALRGLPEGALFQLGGGPVGARENHADVYKRQKQSTPYIKTLSLRV